MCEGERGEGEEEVVEKEGKRRAGEKEGGRTGGIMGIGDIERVKERSSCLAPNQLHNKEE